MLYSEDTKVTIVDVENKTSHEPWVKSTCTETPDNKCLYFGYKNNTYNVQKCYEKILEKDPENHATKTYLDEYSGYMDVMKNIEETNMCVATLCPSNL